jgi:mRNA interferase MazF
LAAKSGDPYCPELGDVVWFTFDPQAGREQAGRRPALVLSPRAYNQISSLCVVCPITSRRRGFPFEVAVPDGLDISGVVLADHVKSASWSERWARLICIMPLPVIEDVRDRIRLLILPDV